MVAALGENQRLGWGISGVLTGTGELLSKQGSSRSKRVQQTRSGGLNTCHLLPVHSQPESTFENVDGRCIST